MRPEKIRIDSQQDFDRLKQAGLRLITASLYQVTGPNFPSHLLIVGRGVDTRLMVAYRYQVQASVAEIRAALKSPLTPAPEVRITARGV